METIDRIEKLLLESGVHPRKLRRELADVCGITVQAVGDWFKGNTKKISPEYIATIAKKWGTTSDYLITGQTEPFKNPSPLTLPAAEKEESEFIQEVRKILKGLKDNDVPPEEVQKLLNTWMTDVERTLGKGGK